MDLNPIHEKSVGHPLAVIDKSRRTETHCDIGEAYAIGMQDAIAELKSAVRAAVFRRRALVHRPRPAHLPANTNPRSGRMRPGPGVR